MSSYNTTAALAALKPPTFDHEGIVYVGVFVSIREWMHWMDVVDRYGQKKLDVNQVLDLHADLCSLWFPPPRREHWWQRWFAPGVSPVWLMLEPLPLSLQVDAITSFLRSQAACFGVTIPEPTVPMFGREGHPTTSGTRPSTPNPNLKKERSQTG